MYQQQPPVYQQQPAFYPQPTLENGPKPGETNEQWAQRISKEAQEKELLAQTKDKNRIEAAKNIDMVDVTKLSNLAQLSVANLKAQIPNDYEQLWAAMEPIVIKDNINNIILNAAKNNTPINEAILNQCTLAIKQYDEGKGSTIAIKTVMETLKAHIENLTRGKVLGPVDYSTLTPLAAHNHQADNIRERLLTKNKKGEENK
jgi:hypothetical protein